MPFKRSSKSPSVGHVFPAPRQHAQPLLDLVHRDGDRPGNVSRRELARGPSVENDDLPAMGAPEQLFHVDRFRVRTISEVLSDQAFQIGESMLRDNAKRATEIEDDGVGESVIDEEPVLAALDQTALPQGPQVLRGVGDRETDLGRQGVDRALALRKQIEKLDPMGVGQRLPDAGVSGIEAVLKGPVVRLEHCVRPFVVRGGRESSRRFDVIVYSSNS